MSEQEKNCKWYFAKEGGREQGLNNALDEKFDKLPYMSLVRESIQNSLDAVLDSSKPVRVEYSFRYIDSKDYPNFFALKDHMKACVEYFSGNPKAADIYGPKVDILKNNSYGTPTVNYIQVSDYNTKGMEYVENDTNNPWYGFVKSVGSNVKQSDGSGGSFGFGKGAYFLISPINTVLVSTKTDSGNTYFSGVAQLCTHKFEGERKTDVGYYGKDEYGNPFTGEDIPEKFRRKEPGTDICIMGVDNKSREDACIEMIESVLRNYWLSILKGKLEVKIDNVEITQSTLKKEMESRFEEEDESKKKDFPMLCNPRPYYEAVAQYNPEESEQGCKYYCDESEILGAMSFYVRPSKTGVNRRIYERALYMMVMGVHETNRNGYYGVFVCDNDKGNELLRSMENSRHDRWEEKNKVRGKAKTEEGKAIEQMEEFISKSLDAFFASESQAEQEVKDLDKYLRIPTSDEDEEDEIGSRNIGTAVNNELKTKVNVPTPVAHKVVTTRDTTASKDENGDLYSGYKGTKHKKKGEDTGAREGDGTDVSKPNPKGRRGRYSTVVTLRATKTYAQLDKDNRVIHTIALVADKDIENIRIVFRSPKEEKGTMEELEVKDTNKGEIGVLQMNGKAPIPCVRKVNLHKGTNFLKVVFTDNIKHSLIITTEKENNENE